MAGMSIFTARNILPVQPSIILIRCRTGLNKRKLAQSALETDLVVYGDCRPVHKAAIQALKDSGVVIHVLEEGYFRPHWITHETGGVNDYSGLPREAEFYLSQPLKKLEETWPVKGSFGALAWYVTLYYFSHLFTRGEKRYPNYKWHFAGGNHHKAFWPWVLKLLQKPLLKLEAIYLQRKILAGQFFLAPLQLCRDYQISEHSDFTGMEEFINYVVKEFALAAPDAVKLVIKNHPLDPELCKLRKATKKAAEANNIKDRVIFIDGGHLPTMLDNAKGLITINSTAGLQAVHHNLPTLVLGRCFYKIEGLVNNVGIADFLNNPQRPDMNLYKHFRNYVMRKTQIGGSFYEKLGISHAAETLVKKMS